MQPANATTIVNGSLYGSATEAFGYIGSDQRLYLMVQQAEPGSPYQAIDVISQWQSEMNVTVPFPRPGAGPRGDGSIAMNALQASDVFFLFEIDQNNHIQALPWPIQAATASFQPDLTERTGALPPASDSSIVSYASESQKSQSVVYVGADGNVWELSWISGQYEGGHPLWQSKNLSNSTGYTGVLAPKRSSPLAAAMFERDGSAHVFYIAGDGTIRELYLKNGEWGGTNLSQTTGAKPPAANSPLAAFASAYENTLHVVYLGADGAVHELWWDGGWQPDHIISGFGGAPPAGDTDLVGYASEFEQSHHVIYIDVNNAIQELYRKDGAWNYTKGWGLELHQPEPFRRLRSHAAAEDGQPTGRPYR